MTSGKKEGTVSSSGLPFPGRVNKSPLIPPGTAEMDVASFRE